MMRRNSLRTTHLLWILAALLAIGLVQVRIDERISPELRPILTGILAVVSLIYAAVMAKIFCPAIWQTIVKIQERYSDWKEKSDMEKGEIIPGVFAFIAGAGLFYKGLLDPGLPWLPNKAAILALFLLCVGTVGYLLIGFIVSAADKSVEKFLEYHINGPDELRD